MLDTPHVLDSLPDYALGCLDEAEARLVREHLSGCLICRTELSAFQAVTAQLALTAPNTVAPAPELKQRLMKQIRPLQPSPTPQPVATTSWFQRLNLRSVWTIAPILLSLVLLIVNLLLWQRLNNQAVLTSPQGMRAITLYSTDVASQTSGFIIIGSDGQNGVLVVDAMPPLEPGKEYQLWLIRDEESASGAVFSVDETGYRGIRIVSQESLLMYSAARITIEPAAGSLHPTGESVMVGLLPAP